MLTFYRKLLLLCLVTAVFTSTQAQKRTILQKGDKIKLEFDEYGKLKSAPPGFVLKTGRTYSFDITSDTAKKRQKELFEFVKKNLAATLARLENPDDNFSMICSAYLVKTDMSELKKEMNELYGILTDKKPVEAFGKSVSLFKYFLGRNFLQTSLFFDAANYKPQFDQGTASQKGKGGGGGSSNTIKAPDDSLEITLTSVDIRKKFLSDYFIESMKVYGSVFNKIKPVSFYTNDIRRDDKLALSIYKIQKELSGLIQQREGHANPEVYFCDAVLYNEYLSMLEQISAFEKDNNLISILKTDWLASWLWFEEGALTLSPLGYTSPELLDRINISDTARSVVFDRYIDSLINRMIVSPELTEPRARVALMDSFLKLRGTGKTRYSKTALIQQMEKENKQKKVKAEEVNTITQQLVFRSVKPGRLDGAFIGGFDASGSLKKMDSKRSFTVPNDFNQEVLVYNLKPGPQDFSVTKTAENIPDQSKLITDLNQAGDLFSGIAGNASTALAGFNAVFKEKLVTGNKMTPFVINFQDLDLQSVNKLVNDKANAGKDYFLNFTLKDGLLKGVYSAETGNVKDQTVDLIKLYEDYWRKSEYGNCALIRSRVETKMSEYFKHTTFTIEGGKLYVREVLDVVESVNKQMDLIVAEVSNELSVTNAYNNLGKWYNYFMTLDSVFGPVAKHQLPPAEMDLDTNRIPSFRSRYEPLEKETGAKQVKYEVTLTDADAKTSIKLKNTYKTAPTHWITGSLGVGYINNSYRRSEVTVTNGVITNSPDEDNVRLLMGLNFHIWPVILADDRSIFNMKEWRQVRTRLSLFAGASFPKPWYNLHAGLSVDIWAGLKLTGGVHFYRHTYYQVLNNQVTDEKSRYESNGAFFGVTMDPGTFVKLIGIFK